MAVLSYLSKSFHLAMKRKREPHGGIKETNYQAFPLPQMKSSLNLYAQTILLKSSVC